MKSLVEFITEAGKYSEDWAWEVFSTVAEDYFENNFKGSEVQQELQDMVDSTENNKSFKAILSIIKDEEHCTDRKMQGMMDIWGKTARSWANDMLR